jgi:DME family drug/metabolite transporter
MNSPDGARGPHPAEHRLFGYACLVAAALCWGSIGPAVRFALDDGASAIEIGFWRALIGAALFAAHAQVVRGRSIARSDRRAMLAFGLVGISLFYGSNVVAVERGGVALAAVLLYSAPALVALAEWIRSRRPPGALTVAALLLTLAGVAGVSLSGAGGVRPDTVAVFWGLVAGACYALHYLFGARYFRRYDAANVFSWVLPVGAVGLLPFADFREKGIVAWVAIIYVAVLPTYAAYRLYAAGLRRVAPTRAATVAAAEPVFAAAFAWALFSETLGVIGYLGAASVIAGVLLVATAGSAGTGLSAPRAH